MSSFTYYGRLDLGLALLVVFSVACLSACKKKMGLIQESLGNYDEAEYERQMSGE